MSVRKGDRSETKLEVLNVIRQLAAYSMGICKNEKIIPKSSRWIMSQRIVNECLDAYSCVRRANAVYVTNNLEYNYRHEQQVEAHAHIDALLGLIDIAYGMYSIESRKIEYWTGLAIQADDALKKWTKSDTERYLNG